MLEHPAFLSWSGRTGCPTSGLHTGDRGFESASLQPSSSESVSRVTLSSWSRTRLSAPARGAGANIDFVIVGLPRGCRALSHMSRTRLQGAGDGLKLCARSGSAFLAALSTTLIKRLSSTEEASPTAAARSKVPPSGRTMTSTPINPARVASPRRHRTVSPRRKIAVSIIKSGAVKLIAVESVSGRRVVA